MVSHQSKNISGKSPRAGAPVGGQELMKEMEPSSHPKADRLVSTRIVPVDGMLDSRRLLLLRCALIVSGFVMKRYQWTNTAEYYVSFDHARHAEVFILLSNHGFLASSWATDSA